MIGFFTQDEWAPELAAVTYVKILDRVMKAAEDLPGHEELQEAVERLVEPVKKYREMKDFTAWLDTPEGKVMQVNLGVVMMGLVGLFQGMLDAALSGVVEMAKVGEGEQPPEVRDMH